MILEILGKLSDGQSLSGAGSSSSTNYIDMASATGYLGNAPDVWLVISTNTAANYTTDETYKIALQCDDNSSFSSPKEVLSLGALNGNDARLATAGKYILRCSLPYECNERYVRLYYTLAGSSPSITVDASISPTKPPSDDNIQVASSNVGVP